MAKKISNIDLHRLTPAAFRSCDKFPIVLVLDNIRSQHNIGAAFRTGDAFRIERVCLCGICACPPSAEMHKSALGAEETVAWTYFNQTLEAVAALKAAGYGVWAVEQVEGAVPLQDFSPPFPADAASPAPGPVALVFGNEVYGVDQAVVDVCDGAIEIPQFGTKHSLNVSVSMGVVLWEVVRKMRLV